MSILSQLKEKRVWERFYRYKEEHFASRTVLAELRGFIDREEYLPVCEGMDFGEAFPLPVRSVINKMNTKKRRVVYTYPPEENTVLKLLTWLLLRRYDDRFEKNLWSFRPGRGAKDAVRELVRFPGIGEMYSYKADISNYFNSVDVDLLLPMLEELTEEDPELYAFLTCLLTEDRVMDRGNVIAEPKGIMAGTPLASFYANLYLAELDRYFSERGILYARYSDDLILFARTAEEREEHSRFRPRGTVGISGVLLPERNRGYRRGVRKKASGKDAAEDQGPQALADAEGPLRGEGGKGFYPCLQPEAF